MAVAIRDLVDASASQPFEAVVASSGDARVVSDLGPPVRVQMSASDPMVLAIGGTTLNAVRPDGAYLGETARNSDFNAYGGG